MAIALRYIKLSREDFRDDCIKIQEQLKLKGYTVPLADISLAWEDYSGSMCAGWMTVDEHSADIILGFLTRMEDD